ncbi:hypothetical protein Sjap_020212 [Stephania japonica]|uniref:Protein FAR1-RELATED SEQUENCE n=1 Tax=Stephania japonica TaxID=461633 RepID=A0AAP0HVE6_9MAGN
MWMNLVQSQIEACYNGRLKELEENYAGVSVLYDYVRDTWLWQKEKFVYAWTNKVLHFGNATTNRTEGVHNVLKKELGTSRGHFEDVFNAIHKVLTHQQNNLEASFNRSMHIVVHEFQHRMYNNIVGFVSKHAFDVISREARLVSEGGVGHDFSLCGYVLRVTHGLPCAHEISIYMLDGNLIGLDESYPHWKKLNMMPIEPTSDGELDNLYRVEMDGVEAKYKSCGPDMRVKIVQKLREITCPASTLLSVPEEELATKGRPKKKGKNLKMKMSKSKKFAVDNSTKRDSFGF